MQLSVSKSFKRFLAITIDRWQFALFGCWCCLEIWTFTHVPLNIRLHSTSLLLSFTLLLVDRWSWKVSTFKDTLIHFSHLLQGLFIGIRYSNGKSWSSSSSCSRDIVTLLLIRNLKRQITLYNVDRTLLSKHTRRQVVCLELNLHILYLVVSAWKFVLQPFYF